MNKIKSVDDIIIYELFNKNYRENVNIIEFEGIIKEELQKINPKLKVIVTPNYFVIINLIDVCERDIIEGVRRISKHKEVYKYVVTASKIARLFRRSNAKRRKTDVMNLLNTYYNHGGTL